MFASIPAPPDFLVLSISAGSRAGEARLPAEILLPCPLKRGRRTSLPLNEREHHLEMPNRRGKGLCAILIDGPGRQDEYRRVAPLLDVVQGARHREGDRAVYGV